MARGRIFSVDPFKMAVVLAFKRSKMSQPKFGFWLKQQTGLPFSGFRIRAWEKEHDKKYKGHPEKLEADKNKMLRLIDWCGKTMRNELDETKIKGKDIQIDRKKLGRKNFKKPIPTIEEEPKFFF